MTHRARHEDFTAYSDTGCWFVSPESKAAKAWVTSQLGYAAAPSTIVQNAEIDEMLRSIEDAGLVVAFRRPSY